MPSVISSDSIITDCAEKLLYWLKEEQVRSGSDVNLQVVRAALKRLAENGGFSIVPLFCAGSGCVRNFNLSPRELQVLKLLMQGKYCKEIARKFSRSVRTMEVHRQAILQKLGFSNMVELTRYAVSMGIVPLQLPQLNEGRSRRKALSKREHQVLKAIAEGADRSKLVASALGISETTAETHRRNIYKKLNLHSIPELVMYAIMAGITSPNLCQK